MSAETLLPRIGFSMSEGRPRNGGEARLYIHPKS